MKKMTKVVVFSMALALASAATVGYSTPAEAYQQACCKGLLNKVKGGIAKGKSIGGKIKSVIQ
jgi:hypothetical protein